jgi:hypothetical protein
MFKSPLTADNFILVHISSLEPQLYTDVKPKIKPPNLINFKFMVYHTYIYNSLYGGKIWSLTLREEHKLRVS